MIGVSSGKSKHGRGKAWHGRDMVWYGMIGVWYGMAGHVNVGVWYWYDMAW